MSPTTACTTSGSNLWSALPTRIVCVVIAEFVADGAPALVTEPTCPEAEVVGLVEEVVGPVAETDDCEMVCPFVPVDRSKRLAKTAVNISVGRVIARS